MRPRQKKLIGILILLPYIAAYVFGAVALADLVPDHWLARLVYFAVAGVAWVFPLKSLMNWMARAPGDA